MADPDARVWNVYGVEYTLVELPPEGKCLQAIINWVEEHCEGEWTTTPTYIAFELASDAILFKLGFK